MVVNVQLDAVSCTVPAAGALPAFPANIGADSPLLAATYSLSGKQNTVDDFYTRYTYQYVDEAGNVLNRATATPSNFVRYCEWPGHRLFSLVKFDVNGNPLIVLSSRG
jgi:hypothetical protein